MTAGPPLLFAHQRRIRPGGAMILRLGLRWALWVLVFVSLGESVRTAYRGYQSVAPALKAAVAGLSTARSALVGAGIHDPLDLLLLC